MTIRVQNKNSMKKSFIYIMVLTAFLSACQDENTFGPNYKPDKMGHMMKLDHSDLSFAAAGGSQTIQVRAKGPHWKFDGLPNWLTISQTSGIGDMAITFTATENTATSPRTATLHFMADERDFSHSKDIKVTQEGATKHHRRHHHRHPHAEACDLAVAFPRHKGHDIEPFE